MKKKWTVTLKTHLVTAFIDVAEHVNVVMSVMFPPWPFHDDMQHL